VSRHIYTGNGVRVTLGYDRPLNYVFCTIEREGEIVYSNLSDPKAGTKQHDINYYRAILAENKISIPDQLFIEVENDQRNRVGNRQVSYTE